MNYNYESFVGKQLYWGDRKQEKGARENRSDYWIRFTPTFLTSSLKRGSLCKGEK